MKIIFVIVFCLSPFATGQRTYLDDNIPILRVLKEIGLKLFATGAEGGRLLNEAKVQSRVQKRIPENIPFPCNLTAGRSETVPTSVHELRPGDIDVIGAMGDSLTAGSGIFATNILHVVIENRGVSALGGGQGTWRDYLTIPNIIKEFNPNLFGFAQRDAATHQEASRFNVAELAAMSRDMPFMARALIRRMRSHPRVDVNNHWKLISILIGHNDFCADMCYLQEGAWSSLKNHKADLIETLRTLKENLPRTLVQVVPPPNLSLLTQLTRRSPFCELINDFECPCLMGLTKRSQLGEFKEIMSRWQQTDLEVASYPEFQTDDFAVVAQPFATKVNFPSKPDGSTDWRYFSKDCFHLSQIANARVSVAIWKNMLEPVGKKTFGWEDPQTISCPTESRPFLATLGNS